MTATPPRLVILCTGNSCRSQMAEAILRHTFGDRIEVRSAGTQPQHQVATGALAALEAGGFPTDGLHPKPLAAVLDQPVALMISVCGRAADHCPTLPDGTAHRHVPFHDPHGEPLAQFIRVRDDIQRTLVPLVADFLRERGDDREVVFKTCEL